MHLRKTPFTARAGYHAAILACLLAGGGAYAQAGTQADADNRTAAGPSWHFSGFGTLGVTHADTTQADFTSTILKPEGAGYTRSWSPHVDSRLGAQASVNFNKQWSAVVQVTTEQRLDGSYRPQVEWANIKYQITPDLSVRAGRIALPMYLAADYRKIGYAYTFVRMPAEVYNAVPVTHSDGIDLNYRWQAMGIKHRTQLSFGRNDTRLIGSYRSRARGVSGLSYSAERGAAAMRISALAGRLTVNIAEDLFNAYRQFGPAGIAIADHYATVNKRTTAFSIGATYDPGNWYVTGEAGQMDTRSLFAKTTSAYASAGYRAGEFTPYLSYARIRAGVQTVVEGLPTMGLPPQMADLAGMLNAGLNAYLSFIPIQSSVGAGVRWDIMSNVAFKLQYDRLKPSDGSRGTLINQQPGFRSGQHVDAASATLDFVF